MNTSRYSEIAHSAALHEKCGSLDQAAKLWRQANELAVLKPNLDWTAHRAHVCESRLRLVAKAARVRNGEAAFSMQTLSPEKSERRGLAKLAFAGPRR